jgi:hypothetical protein
MSRHFKTEIELEPVEERSTAAVGVSAVVAALVGRM